MRASLSRVYASRGVPSGDTVFVCLHRAGLVVRLVVRCLQEQGAHAAFVTQHRVLGMLLLYLTEPLRLHDRGNFLLRASVRLSMTRWLPRRRPARLIALLS